MRPKGSKIVNNESIGKEEESGSIQRNGFTFVYFKEL